jgi:hypothetical protein
VHWCDPSELATVKVEAMRTRVEWLGCLGILSSRSTRSIREFESEIRDEWTVRTDLTV